MKVFNPRLVRLARRLDPLWVCLAALRAKTRGVVDPATAQSVLVIDLHLVGDMVMLLPLLESIRTSCANARVTLVAGPWSRDILAGSGLVDEFVDYVAPWVKPQPKIRAFAGFARLARMLARRPWDIGIDVRGDVRQILMLWIAGCRRRIGFDFSGGGKLLTDIVADDGTLRHILDHHRRIAEVLAGHTVDRLVPEIRLTEQERLQANRIEPYIGFHFGASLALRRLPPEHAAQLIVVEAAKSADPLLLFSAPDMETHTRDVLECLPPDLLIRVETWQGPLREFVVTIARARRVFVMDSGPAHIAAAAGRSTVVFFGPNRPEFTAPIGRAVRIVEDLAVPCRPCDQHHCIHRVQQACMRSLVSAWSRAPRDDDRLEAVELPRTAQDAARQT